MSYPLAHTGDPLSSHLAADAVRISPATERIKNAVLVILLEKPRAVFEVQNEYFSRCAEEDWPSRVPRHSIARRMSELHKAHAIRIADVPMVRGEWDKDVCVWEVTPGQ